jgi:hypothetical protein
MRSCGSSGICSAPIRTTAFLIGCRSGQPRPRPTAMSASEHAAQAGSWPYAHRHAVLADGRGTRPRHAAWEAEEILGAGPYELDVVEKAALEHYRTHAHARDPYSYWVTTTQAAALPGISDVRVKQLLNGEKIPFERHRSGKRLMRRHQVDVIGNARQSRKLGGRIGN